MKTQQKERGGAVESAVVALLDVAVVLDQNALICKLCNERDESHTEACPVPALEQWLLNVTEVIRMSKRGGNGNSTRTSKGMSASSRSHERVCGTRLSMPVNTR
jgi:hypothetical protein